MKPIVNRPDILKNIRAVGLYELIKDLPVAGIGVEIGCLAGQSSEIFALTCDHITCVDSWLSGYDDNDPMSKENLRYFEAEFDTRMKSYSNVTKLKMTSSNAVARFNDHTLDFVYIDGLHTYAGVSTDIKLWLPKIKIGGAICGHDYDIGWAGVMKAVDERFNTEQIIRYQDTSWMVLIK